MMKRSKNYDFLNSFLSFFFWQTTNCLEATFDIFMGRANKFQEYLKIFESDSNAYYALANDSTQYISIHLSIQLKSLQVSTS